MRDVDERPRRRLSEGPLSPPPPREQSEAGVWVFGGVAVTSLVTTSAGSLAGALAFAGQQHHVEQPALDLLTCGVAILGFSLISSLICAAFAYLSQLGTAFPQPDGKGGFRREPVWIRLMSISAGLLCIPAITVGGSLMLVAARAILAAPDQSIMMVAAPARAHPNVGAPK